MREIKEPKFNFWESKNFENVGIKGVVVLVPGSNGDGRYLAYDQVWQEFAIKHRLLLVGCFFQDVKMRGDEWYCNMRSGSGNRLLDAVKAYLVAPLPPFYLWGHSAGGQFAYEFAMHYPEKTGAFVANKGGVYYTALASDEARKVPGLILTGKYDAPWRRNILKGIYDLNKAFGANWTYVEEETGHEDGNSQALAMTLFSRHLKR